MCYSVGGRRRKGKNEEAKRWRGKRKRRGKMEREEKGKGRRMMPDIMGLSGVASHF